MIAAAAIAGRVEAIRLDPTRSDPGPEPAPPRRRFSGGPAGSLLLHLLPLLALVTWLRPPLEMPAPIPVQLVIEQPPPPPPAPAPETPKTQPRAPPQGRLASDDFGKVGPDTGPKSPDTEQRPQSKPPSSGTEAPVAEPMAAAKPEPTEPPKQTVERTASLVAPPVVEPLAQPTLPAVSLQLPPPPPPPEPPAKHRPAERPPALTGLVLPLPLHADSRSAAVASAHYPGPSATRDEYCAYALSLTLRHLDLLPNALLGARRGETTVTIRLRADGSIMNAMVARSSGYTDIDERVTQMVYAVGKFPPLPSWVSTPVAAFTFRLHFPHPPSR